MSISLTGPPWPTVTTLREALATSPETGTFRLGGPPTDSITQLTKFREAGLSTPEFTTDVTVAKEWVAAGSIVFGRKLLHTRGNDIVLPGHPDRPNRRWVASDWWSLYLPPTDEWRVHIVDGHSIARGRKILTGKEWRKAPVRNISNGWTFDFTTDPPKGVRTAAKKAMAAVGYRDGAVDILLTGSDPIILECNRVPALTCSYTRNAWIEAIRRYVREHS